MIRLTVVASVFMVMALSGCVDNGASPSDEPRATGPSYDDSTGGVEGLVTDEEFQPLAEVTVALLERAEASSVSDADGRFALSNVPPGSYRLAFQKLGYETRAVIVEVRAAESTLVQVALPLLPVEVPYPETLIMNGIIRHGVGLVRTATCSNCAINDNNKETVARFPKGKLPMTFAGIMIESTWKSRDYIGIDFLDRSKSPAEMYWRVRSTPPIHFLLEKCGNYVGEPWYGRQPMPCDEESLSSNKIHVENWYIGEFQRETHNLDSVCRIPIAVGSTNVVSGYEAGCYGLGFAPELRFTNYLTVFHHELPADADKLSFMPDA